MHPKIKTSDRRYPNDGQYDYESITNESRSYRCSECCIDGADAVMLSAETSVGKHPVKVVEAMNRIIAEAEQHYNFQIKNLQLQTSPLHLFQMQCALMQPKLLKIFQPQRLQDLQCRGIQPLKRPAIDPNALFIFSQMQYICSVP